MRNPTNTEVAVVLVDHPTYGPCLLLGEEGRGRWLERVGLDKRRPLQLPEPVTSWGKTIYRPQELGLSVWADASGRPHAAFTEPTPGDRRWVLQLDTSAPYHRGRNGSIEVISGDAQRVTGGTWAWGAAGYVGSGPDDLWIAHPGAVIAVNPGGTATRLVVVCGDDEVRVLTRAEWEREAAEANAAVL